MVGRQAFATGVGRVDLFGRVAAPMPSSEPAGFTRIWSEDFTTDYAIGSFDAADDANGIGRIKSTSPAYATYQNKISLYPDGGDDTGHFAKYYPSKTISTTTSLPGANGALRIWCHTETIGGVATPCSAWIRPITPNDVNQRLTYGRFSYRMRASNMFGWGGVFLTIAQNWPADGEDDWNENPFWLPPGGHVHYAAGSSTDTFSSVPTSPKFSTQDWHVYTQEWSPGRIRYLMDGVVYYDSTSQVGTGPRQHVYQCGGDGQVPPASSSGYVDIDWWTVAAYTG